MFITNESTVKEIIEQYPEAINIFEQHGVCVPLECDESILDTELDLCQRMCHIDDLPGLISDLQYFVDHKH